MSDAGPTPERPGAWRLRPALALAGLCLVMAVVGFGLGLLADEPRAGWPWNAAAFLGTGLMFLGQAGTIVEHKFAPVAMVVGATTAAFGAWVWLTALGGPADGS